MVNIFFNKSATGPLAKSQMEKIISLTAKFEKRIKGTVEVTIVSENKITQLNKKFRGKNKITDVLSFSLIEGGEVAGPFFGELYLCSKQIIRQAKGFGVPIKQEFARMLVHGLLHLAGHDHINKSDANKMFSLQEKVVSKAIKEKII